MYDYIIVGGGSAGCVTAGRLVGEFGARVLLLEQGGSDRHPLLRMPAGFIKMLKGSRYLTFHKTLPQEQLDGRVHDLPQGHVLGGGSTVNAMVYMRGRPSDYQHWVDATGDEGWGWDSMLKHYVRQESNQRLNNAAHGVDGPLKVSNHTSICEMSHIYVRTLQGMGHPFTSDFNAGEQRGVGYMQLTAANGRRCSAVDAFLSPVQENERLTIKLNADVQRLVIENGKVTGVEFDTGKGRETAHASAEVIVTAGAFGSPKLLMLSGIGPADHLGELGIETVADLPGVGQNLMDHHEVPVVASTDGAYGYFREDVGWKMIRNGLQYMLFRSGPVTSNGVEACAFVDPYGGDAEPAIKLYCVPTVYLDRDISSVKPTHGVTLNSCLVQPRSRGWMKLASANPADMPLIQSNYLADPGDVRDEIAGLRFARQVLASHPLSDVVTGELFPGADIDDDEALAAHCRRTVKTNYHASGTCRMGREDDPMAVLTPDLRVKGVEGLRVFDVSAMPHLVSANTNAPVMAVADRAVDLMMGQT
ncbi:MAG: GMC family oxidoreductase N-terminal domain-containing protein [Pseudomonadota bacterium]